MNNFQKNLSAYRAATAASPPINHRQKYCHGRCRRNRSVGQFLHPDSKYCIRCADFAPESAVGRSE
jgi:hypothetical protein